MKKHSIWLRASILSAFVFLIGSQHIFAQAKFYFSTNPFTTTNAGGKTSFKTSEFIYGRLELPATIQEHFKVPATNTDHPVDFFAYTVRILKDGKPIGNTSNWPFTPLSKEDLKKKYWNFDVLPKPELASTVLSGTSTFSSGKASAPLYGLFERENFPQNGKYTVKITIACIAYDPYDPTTAKPMDQWTNVSGEFELVFSTDDLPALQTNWSKANSLVAQNAKQKAMQERGLPKEWNMTKAPISSGIAESKLKELIEAKLKSGSTIIKLVIQPSAGGNTWLIEKNNVGIPIMKYHNQPYGAFYRTPDGGCRYIEGNLQQDYSGAGTYEETYFRNYRVDDVDCKFIDGAINKAK